MYFYDNEKHFAVLLVISSSYSLQLFEYTT